MLQILSSIRRFNWRTFWFELKLRGLGLRFLGGAGPLRPFHRTQVDSPFPERMTTIRLAIFIRFFRENKHIPGHGLLVLLLIKPILFQILLWRWFIKLGSLLEILDFSHFFRLFFVICKILNGSLLFKKESGFFFNHTSLRERVAGVGWFLVLM